MHMCIQLAPRTRLPHECPVVGHGGRLPLRCIDLACRRCASRTTVAETHAPFAPSTNPMQSRHAGGNHQNRHILSIRSGTGNTGSDSYGSSQSDKASCRLILLASSHGLGANIISRLAILRASLLAIQRQTKESAPCSACTAAGSRPGPGCGFSRTHPPYHYSAPSRVHIVVGGLVCRVGEARRLL